MNITQHKIAISGASGFIGSHLTRAFKEMNWEVLPLGREEFQLVPAQLADRLQGVDTIVNLAGAPVIKRWTEEYKKTMYESRIGVTKKLVDACSLMGPRPALFISTSAVGYYAAHGEHTEEHHEKADDFLGHMAQDWEEEASRAGDLDIRTVVFRFGIVLGKDGGALKQMLVPFKSGLGGTIGDGSQPFSWVHIKDLTKAFFTVIDNNSYEGVYNLTAPNPTTNKGLTRALSRALNRPAFLSIPEFVLRLQFGEGAQTLTKGQHVVPRRLLDSGFSFSFTDIETAVKDCI